MADTKFKPVKHNHEELIAKARKRPGFDEAYQASELEYALVDQMLKANCPQSVDHACFHAIARS